MTSSPVAVTLAELVQLAPKADQLTLWQSRCVRAEGGNNNTVFKGRGMEFAETRPYQPGDDVRLIDWRVTARTGRAHTKLFREERERPVVTWVDCRPQMFFATRGVFKSVLAARMAALVAWSAHGHGDRFGGRICGDDQEWVQVPAGGRHGVLRYLRALELACANWRVGKRPSSAAIDVRQSLASLRRTVRPGTVLFLISDYRDLQEPVGDLLADAGRHCDITLCFVHDPLEATLPPPGDYPIADRGTRQAMLFARDNQLRRHYHQRFIERRKALQDLAWQHRARLITSATTDDALRVLRNACGQRARHHQRRAV